MREEEEKKQKELEERRKKEEEEERIRIEQEEKEEEERRILKEEKKRLAKERKVIALKEQETKRLESIRSQLLNAYGTSANTDSSAPPEQKKRVVYGDKRKKKPKDTETTPIAPTQVDTTPAPVVEQQPAQKIEEQKVEEEVELSWEDKDLDTIEAQLLGKEEPVVTPSATTTTASTATTQPEVAESSSSSNNNNGTSSSTKEEEEENKEGELRSPICCILGHVDTGKTKLLDNIRKTNVQEGEAGGITQQIGATFFPMDTVKEKTKKLAEQFNSLSIKVPGLLIIDTPGHESFNNLRTRGSGLCDIAVLVVDIMHGLEPQTIESINLLKMRKTPFIVALNKIDRIYGWQSIKDEPIQSALLKQTKQVQMEFEDRVKETIGLFAGQSLNAQLYYKNKSLKEFRTIVSLVPTSAIDGTGIPDLLMLLIQLTQKLMADKLLHLSQLQCTVLEVKAIEGLGTTIDCILVNGVLHEGDTIVVCGLNGPIVTNIRALLTPQPLKEMRVKGTYVHHKVIHASQGVKISAQDLDKAIAGSSLFVCGPNDDLEALKKEVMQDLENMRKKVDISGKGVWVQASTLGSLEALLEFLKQSKIPVSGVNIGPVNKKDVMRSSIMLEHSPEFAVILAFDVKVTKDASDLAESMGVKIFTAEIIYHLFDQFTAYMKLLNESKKTEAAAEAVFPARLRIYPEYIFNKKDPIVLGVEILEGSLRIGTPICVPSKDCIELGKITSIELNHKAQDKAKKGLSVAIKIEVPVGDQQKAFGRHFDDKDELVSKVAVIPSPLII
jgi:translation initiation factor 5B